MKNNVLHIRVSPDTVLTRCGKKYCGVDEMDTDTGVEYAVLHPAGWLNDDFFTPCEECFDPLVLLSIRL